MKMLARTWSALGISTSALTLLLAAGCVTSPTLQYPPFPDQTKRIEDPAKARVYVMRGGVNVFGGTGPVVVYGTDWAATGPVFDPSQKVVVPLMGVFPDNYRKSNERRRIGEVGAYSYICWETPPQLLSFQRVEGDTNTTYSVDMKAGNVYFLRASRRPGWVANKLIIEEIPEPEALSLLKDCKPPNSYRK